VQTATFDRNTWQETDLSRAELRAMAPDVLMLEGYAPSKRRFLNDVKTDGDIVPVDGVGGCVLLVDAELHRSGLVFPPYVFDHHIETEGFAKAVAKFGVSMYGLPSVNVIHW
jgi:mannan polymerase complexes MNN9 subunit